MQNNRTKILIISAVVLVIVLAAYGAWLTLSNKANKKSTEGISSLLVPPNEPNISDSQKALLIDSLMTPQSEDSSSLENSVSGD